MGCKGTNQTNEQTKHHRVNSATKGPQGYGISCVILQSFFQQFWEKAPGQNWEKVINNSKIGRN